MVVSLPLYCVQVLQPRVQTHDILNEDQPQVSENMFRSWDVFNNYQPEFKTISRVRRLENTTIYYYIVFKIIILFH
jgi:hypothetical protein